MPNGCNLAQLWDFKDRLKIKKSRENKRLEAHVF